MGITRIYKIVEKDNPDGTVKSLQVTETQVNVYYVTKEQLEERKTANATNSELIDEQLTYFKD